MTDKKVYLGDSVYADVDPFGGLRLTTENGFGPTNTIVLEPQVIATLLDWVALQMPCATAAFIRHVRNDSAQASD